MTKVIFNSDDVLKTGKQLVFTSNEINRNLVEIDKLLDLLLTTLNDDKTKKICEEIKNKQILDLKEDSSRLLNIDKFLIKMSQAYNHFDNDMK